MEKDKELTKEEAEQVAGGKSGDPSLTEKVGVLCLRCKSPDVSVSIIVNPYTHKISTVHHCNNCGFKW